VLLLLPLSLPLLLPLLLLLLKLLLKLLVSLLLLCHCRCCHCCLQALHTHNATQGSKQYSQWRRLCYLKTHVCHLKMQPLFPGGPNMFLSVNFNRIVHSCIGDASAIGKLDAR